MPKFFLLLIIPTVLFAQDRNIQTSEIGEEDQLSEEATTFHEYVSLNENKVYDIEIIVFAYNQALPNYKTYTNKFIYDDSEALELQAKPDDIDFLKQNLIIDNESESKNENDINTQPETNLTVPIDDIEEDQFVLTWFQHQPEYYKLTPIWDRLINNDNITPLIHQSWRQIETPFDNPTYVKLNNLIDQDNTTDNDTLNNTDINLNAGIRFTDNIENDINEEVVEDDTLGYYPDFTVTGMVALSQGRFMHFGHKLNLIRRYLDENNENQQMVFSLSERKQLKTDELHYFDSPWFGSIVKITEYTGEEQLVEEDEE